MSYDIVTKGLLYHNLMFTDQIPEGTDEISVPERVYEMFVLMVSKPIVLSYKL